MIEIIIALVLLIVGIINGEPSWFIASGMFSLSGNLLLSKKDYEE